MRASLDLLRHERRARLFFVALTQSSLGTGAGYVALLLIARDRFDSPWAITLVLLADVVPAMLLGPIFGAAADRWSRRRCTVTADVFRALAFGGVAVVGSFEATVAFALLAGIGTGLFTPSALAALPSLVDEPRRIPATTSLFGAIADLGYTLGPAVAAAVLLVGGAEMIMVANAVSFGMSALLLALLPFGAAPQSPAHDGPGPSLLSEARDGVRAVAKLKGIRVVILGSSAALFCGGLFNVGELFFATEELGAGDSGFSVLVTLFGLGFLLGSLSGSNGGALPVLKRLYLGGLLLMGLGFLASGLAPSFVLAMFTFAAAGFGNGMLLVYERLLIQSTVEDRLAGRVFGVKDAMASWAFALAFVSAGVIIAIIGTRPLLALAGGIGVAVFLISTIALRRMWRVGSPQAQVPAPRLEGGADAALARRRAIGQHGAYLVGGRGAGFWLRLLDDVEQRRDDARVELSSGVGT
jgi:MFS family permease